MKCNQRANIEVSSLMFFCRDPCVFADGVVSEAAALSARNLSKSLLVTLS